MQVFARAAGVLAAAALIAPCLAAPAGAAGIVYADKGNVWVATPDGSVNRALTTDGTETTPDYANAPKGELVGPYHYPSADDSGRIISARYRYGQEGGANFFWKVIGPDGAHVASNIVSMYQCGSATGPLGPFDARISADGGYVVFSFYCAGRYVGLNPVTFWQQDAPEWGGERPSWFGQQLIASSSGTAYAQDAAGAPLTDTWGPWITGDTGESIGRAEVARGGGRAAIESTVGGVQSLVFVTFSGGIPNSTDGATKCRMPTAPARRDAVDDEESFFASFSPDGTMITWVDAEGVKVAPVPDLTAPQNGAGQTCTLPGAARVLSPTGRTPHFTAYTWTNPPATDPGTAPGGTTPPGTGTTPPPGGTTTTPPAARLTGRLPASVKASALARGVTLKLTVSGPGSVLASATTTPAVARRLGVRGRTVASGKRAAKAAGATTVKLRIVARGRRRASRLRGKRLSVRVVFTSAAGQRSTLRKTVRVR